MSDNAVLIDQQKIMYENRIEYLIKEIDSQNSNQEQKQEILSKLTLLRDILSEPKDKLQGGLIENKGENNIDFQKEVDAYREQLNLKISENENSLKQLQKLEEDVELKDRTISQMKHNIETFSANVETAEKARDDLFNKLCSVEEKEAKEKKLYNEQLEIKDDIISNMKEEMKIMTEKFEISEKKIQDLLEKKSSTIERERKYKLEVDKNNEIINELKKEIVSLRNKVDTVEKERSREVTCKEELRLDISKLQKENDALHEKLKSLNEKDGNSKDELKLRDEVILTLKAENHNNEAAFLETLKLKEADIAEMKNQIDALKESIIYELNVKDETIAKIQKQMEELMKKYETTHKAQKNLFEKLQSVEEERAKLKIIEICFMKELDKKGAIIEEMKENINILTSKEISYEEGLAKKDANITELKQKMGALVESAAALEETKVDLLEKLRHAEVLEKEHMHILEAKNSVIADMEKQINLLLERVAVLETEKEDLIMNVSSHISKNPAQKSCPSSPKSELSPKDIRRRKRQSIHDQRRGLEQDCSDFLVTEDITVVINEQLIETLKKREEDITSLKSEIDGLRQENQNLEMKIQNLSELTRCPPRQTCQTQTDVLMECKNCTNLEAEIKTLKDLQRKDQFKIVGLQTKLYDLKNAQEYERSCQLDAERRVNYKIETLQNELTQLKSKEKVSIGSQCNLNAKADGDTVDKHASDHETMQGKDLLETIKKQEGTIKVLNEQIEELSAENHVLDMEVRHFMDEVSECKKHIKELEETTTDTSQPCTKCSVLEGEIKQMAELQKKNQFKIVDLQTKIYDMKNTQECYRNNQEDKERRMAHRVVELENALAQSSMEKIAIGVQCELDNYNELLQKYGLLKKVARLRRDEGNILRSRLGMEPDEPVK